MEDLLQSEQIELPQTLPQETNQRCLRVILTWVVYFILLWQYKNYVSDNAIEQLLKFVQQILFCIGHLIKEHTELCFVLATNLPTTLYSARKFLVVTIFTNMWFVQNALNCTKWMKLWSIMDDNLLQGPVTIYPFQEQNVQKLVVPSLWCPEDYLEKWVCQILCSQDILLQEYH